jgi:cytosine/adenosine deaminase-related metal-dependent hydrolase
VRFGIQPHAPYTVGFGGFEHAVALGDERGWPLCTHAAESSEERALIGQGVGPARELLEMFGLWEDRLLASIGKGRTPIEFLGPALRARAWLLAHVNDTSDRDIETIAGAGASVVYCPRSSAYFGAAEHFEPHRYREMIDAGVNV